MSLRTVNPPTGEPGREYAAMDAREVERRLERAARAARAWARVPVRERAAVVQRAGDLLDRDRARHAALMTEEMGKLLVAD